MGTSVLDCPSLEAEDALIESSVPERYQIEFVLARADCEAHNARILGD